MIAPNLNKTENLLRIYMLFLSWRPQFLINSTTLIYDWTYMIEVAHTIVRTRRSWMYQRPFINLHNSTHVDLFTLWICQIYTVILYTGDMLGGIKRGKAYHQEETLRNARQVSNKRGNNPPAFPHRNTSALDVIFWSGSTMITLPFLCRQISTMKWAGDTCSENPTIIPWAYDKYNASIHKWMTNSVLVK